MPRPEHTTAFDLDMTLISSDKLVRAAFHEMAAQEGLAGEVYEVLEREGEPLDRRLEAHFDAAESLRLTLIFRKFMRGMGFSLTETLPGALESIEAARRYGRVAIVTAKPQDLAQMTLAHHSIEGIELVGGSFDDKHTALQRLGAEVYVGDHTNDMVTARKAGVALSIGVATGICSAQALRADGAEFVLGSLETFPELLSLYHDRKHTS